MSYSEHFSIKNIPYGIASDATHPQRTVATRIHDHVVFLQDLDIDISEDVKSTFGQPTLNALAATTKSKLRELRAALQKLLADSSVVSKHGVPIDQVELHLPIEPTGFTDFSCSYEHLLNAGEATMGVRQLPPAGPYYPIGYNGRASSVRVSGTPVTRPWGQYYKQGSATEVVFGPSQSFDFELEMAAIVGKPSKLGERVSIEDADEHIFGLVLLNDWSARDIQRLEMNPLGPINGKSTLTSISPWVVTLEALEPFAVAPPPRKSPVAKYLQDSKEKASYQISLEAEVTRKGKTTRVCNAQLSWMYWTFRDLVAQQTINGCDIRTGDLLATGTVSGTADDQHGCLLEMLVVRKKSVTPPTGDEILWLEDGDETRFVGYCGDGVGFGDCVGVLKPATTF